MVTLVTAKIERLAQRACVFVFHCRNKKIKYLCFALSIVGCAASIFAQSKPAAVVSQPRTENVSLKRLEVGDSKITGADLKPCENFWNLTQKKPGEAPEEVGTWSDSIERTSFQKHPAFKRTQVANYHKKGVRLTFVSMFDPKTMEPFSFDYSRSDNGNVRHVEFRHETVTYRHKDATDSPPQETTVKLDRPVFDFYGGMYGILISTLPLDFGYQAEIPALDTNNMAVDWVSVRVTGRETVGAGPGKAAEAWVVETATKLYGRMTWWVTKKPPYVIKAVLEIPKDESGSGEIAATLTYTMARPDAI